MCDISCTPLQFNGHHLLNIPARDAKSYARSLLDVLFTKAEQAKGLVYSKKSANRELLDQKRTQILFGWFEMCILIHTLCKQWMHKHVNGFCKMLTMKFCFLYAECVEERFGSKTFKENMTEILRTLNQKCRDACKNK